MSAADQANELFDQALLLESAEARAAFLARACVGNAALRERVERLLAAHEKAGDFLNAPAAGEPSTVVSPPAIEEGPGTAIGRYKLLEKIGEGGFGVVYVAEQREPVKRRVALKILKLGMDTKQVVARFEAERQALALMDHPNIAKVLDAGATDTGRPYFVMELVKGIPITQYCDQEKLSTQERLDLFIKVCHAIQHAHQKGIIHRDIKPSNILVTLHDGVAVPKVIDFGIAKATQGELTDKTVYTQFQQFIGTPAYMSPEQAEMSGLDIDTRSDIYSLGVLLYELLTGSTPFDTKELVQSGLDEMRKIIREREPVRPSTRLTQQHAQGKSQISNHKSQIPSDLDWIAMKCLEKDRMRRYETANGLAMDLQRHLHNEPVLARPPSAGYRLQKAWRRNKVVYSAGIAVAAALVIGLAISTWLFVQESKAYRSARAAEAEQLRLRDLATRALEGETAQRLKAESASQQAKASELATRRQAYGADINLAQQALAAGKLGVALGLLNQPVYQEQRGWEWRYLWQETRNEASCVLTRESSGVGQLAASPDGSWLALLRLFGGLQLWDPVTRQTVAGFSSEGNTRPAFSAPHGLLAYKGALASPTNQSGVRIWDPRTRQHVAELPARWCRGFGFSADEKIVVTCDDEGNLVRWQLPEGRKLSTFTCDPLPKYDNSGVPFALNGDARLAAIGGFSGEVVLVDLQAGRELWRSTGADGRGYSLAFSPDGKVLAVGTGNKAGYILLLDAATGRELRRLVGHRSGVSGLVFWPDGTRLASASMDQCIGLWDLRDPLNVPPPRMLRGHKLEVWSLALLADGRTLASGSKDGEVCLWDTSVERRERFTTSPEVASGAIWCLSNEGPTISGVDLAAHELLEWPDPSHVLHRTPMAFERGARRACWSRDGRLLAVGSTNGSVQIWELSKRSLMAEFSAGTVEAVPLQFDIDHQRLALAVGNQFEIWTFLPVRRTLSAQLPQGYQVIGYSGYVDFSQELSPGLDQVLAVGSRDAKLWTPASGASLELRTDTGTVLFKKDFETCVAFSPDGNLLATCSLSGRTLIYDTRTGLQMASLQPFFNGATCLAFSPDGARLAVGSGGDGDIKLYDVETWRDLLTVPSGAEWVIALKFSRDGAALRAELGDSPQSTMLRAWRPPAFEEIALAEAKDKPEAKHQ